MGAIKEEVLLRVFLIYVLKRGLRLFFSPWDWKKAVLKGKDPEMSLCYQEGGRVGQVGAPSVCHLHKSCDVCMCQDGVAASSRRTLDPSLSLAHHVHQDSVFS